VIASPRRFARGLVALALGGKGSPRRTLAPVVPDAVRSRQQLASLAARQERLKSNLT
jgi:hypothetical protein